MSAAGSELEKSGPRLEKPLSQAGALTEFSLCAGGLKLKAKFVV